ARPPHTLAPKWSSAPDTLWLMSRAVWSAGCDGPGADHASAAARCGGFRAEHRSHSDWRHDEAEQRVTPGCDASGPAVLRDHTTCPEEQSYAEAPSVLGVCRPSVGRI